MATDRMIQDGYDWYFSASGVTGTSNPVMIADEQDLRHYVTFFITPNAGTSKIQITGSKRENVEAGSAVWYDWSLGDVTSPTVDGTEFPVTAARVVVTSGTADWEVRVG